MPSIIFVWGTTCVGKSTFMAQAQEIMGSRVGLVEVGKEMRRRYPPERFRGLGAMEDTEDEVFEIYTAQLRKAFGANCDFILVDGQPRLPSQIDRVLSFFPAVTKKVWWLFAEEETVNRRLNHRFKEDEEGFKLAQQRVTNDKVQLYPIAWELLHRRIPILTIEHYDGFNHPLFWKGL